MFRFNVKKSCSGVQKTEKYMISKYQYLKWKISQYSMRVIVLKDITLTTQCFFVLFLLSLLQQVFNDIPANQIIISIYN